MRRVRKAGQLKFAIDYFEQYTLLQPNEVEVSAIRAKRLRIDFFLVFLS